ncbi:hypothetical protein EMCRGX_G012730 [Ephydatia muelleri]
MQSALHATFSKVGLDALAIVKEVCTPCPGCEFALRQLPAKVASLEKRLQDFVEKTESALTNVLSASHVAATSAVQSQCTPVNKDVDKSSEGGVVSPGKQKKPSYFSTIDPITEARVCRKFEIAYVLCKEGLAFRKKVPFCELEEKHGVDLGIGYKNRDACADFVKYIAQVQMDQLTTVLAKAKFLSIEADGTTDAANKEEELFMVVYFDRIVKIALFMYKTGF